MRRTLSRVLIGLLILVALLLWIGKLAGARLHYGDDPLAANWDGEGPYVSLTEDGGMILFTDTDSDGAPAPNNFGLVKLLGR